MSSRPSINLSAAKLSLSASVAVPTALDKFANLSVAPSLAKSIHLHRSIAFESPCGT